MSSTDIPRHFDSPESCENAEISENEKFQVPCPNQNKPLPLKKANLPDSGLSDSILPKATEIISAHPEIFKVKMLAKKNVRTISTMSSSNYENSDNSSTLGKPGKFAEFKIPKRRFYERDILTECADNHTLEIDNSLAELLRQQENQNRSKDDLYMQAAPGSEEAMQEYMRLIRDSPFLLKRSFLYNRDTDQMKIKEREQVYDLSLQNVKSLFGDDNTEFEDKEMQVEDGCQFSFSPQKELPEGVNDDLLSISSDCKPYCRLNEPNMDLEDNYSAHNEPHNFNSSQCDNRSYLSHSSYVEDIEAELKDYNPKNIFKTPHKRQRFTASDGIPIPPLSRQDSDHGKYDTGQTPKVRFLTKNSLKMLEATYGHAKKSMLKSLGQMSNYSVGNDLCPIYEDDEQQAAKNEFQENSESLYNPILGEGSK